MNKKLINGLSKTLVFTLLAAHINSSYAVEELKSDQSSNLGIGFDISSYSNNYALGLSVASPRFFNDTSIVKLTADLAWVQGVENGGNTTDWFSYGLYKLGYFSGKFIDSTPIRVYGGGGLVALTPSSSLSSSGVSFGGFGLSGVEFFVNPKRSKCLFVEFGGMGTGATAHKLTDSPIYANGFTMSWGYQYYL